MARALFNRPVYDQSEIWPRMERAALDAVAALPDFPGFATRSMCELDCPDKSHARYELSYCFSLSDSHTPMVRSDYVRLLRQHLPIIGYEIHDERVGADGGTVSLEAAGEDGVNLWYRVLGLVSLKVQTGCVRRVEGFEPYCPHPIGGVAREHDAALDFAADSYVHREPDLDPIASVDPDEL